MKEQIENKKFHAIVYFPKDDYSHQFKIYNEHDNEEEFRRSMNTAYDVGL
ncbi:MAG: hypothetical protein AB1728_01145 [Bacteroidota bacterium]